MEYADTDGLIQAHRSLTAFFWYLWHQKHSINIDLIYIQVIFYHHKNAP